MKYKHLILSLSLIMLGPLAHAEEIGSVDTVFKMIGPDHKIVVEAFDDPDVKNVTCYVSRAKTGGIKGGLGLAEDTSDAAISCQQVGPIELSERIKKAKPGAKWYSRNVHRWSLSRYRLCASMMPNAMRSPIWLTPTKLSMVHRKMPSAPSLSCRGDNNRGDLCNGKRSG